MASKYPKLTHKQLAEKYPDEQFHRKLISLLDTTAVLRESIIGEDYRIPDAMNQAIVLSAYGTEIANTLTTKHDVPYKEAKLMCFLTIAYRDLLIDVDKTDLDGLLKEISQQIISGTIRHPFTLGRQLYDKAADLFPDEREYLSITDTNRLLEGSPQGVFQSGQLITGPFGIISSVSSRSFPPTTYIPLQHCADLACDSVHDVQLTTDHEAPINVHRPKLNRLLEKNNNDPSDWVPFTSELIKKYDKSASEPVELDTSGVIGLLGDALTDIELRSLLEDLLDKTGGQLRGTAANLNLVGRAEKISESIDRARMLQLVLTLSDDEIVAALDRLVRAKTIDIPPDTPRQPQINDRRAGGRWGLLAEIGTKGVRFRSRAGSQVALLRLRQLVSKLFDSNSLDQMAELDWILRSVDSETPAGKLAEFVRFSSPRHVVETLVLSRRQTAEQVCDSLGLSAPGELADDELVDSVLWKLGFNLPGSGSENDKFFSRHAEILRLTRAASLSSTFDEEPIRRVAGVYFSALEALLQDSLIFATWALTTDHYSSDRPYVFRPNIALPTSFQVLSEAARNQARTGPNGDLVRYDEHVTLQPLFLGFKVLSGHLEALRDRSESFVRPPEQVPELIRNTNLQEFPFTHTVPFFDLQIGAQSAVIQGLESVGSRLLASDMADSRNALSHFRRTSVNLSKVIAGLEAVWQSIGELDSLGFIRKTFRMASATVDEWGRRIVVLRDRDNQEVTFSRPSRFDWLGLPTFSTNQYLVHSAVFADPNEILRFSLGTDSPYENHWAEYPKRREPRSHAFGKQSESASADVDATGRSSARSG